ncbi:MAG: hypothetical protein VX622_12085, partial [Pseudomonadota bacterium]|nr:hypothetical protein [Pseudomonadota bacterium]
GFPRLFVVITSPLLLIAAIMEADQEKKNGAAQNLTIYIYIFNFRYLTQDNHLKKIRQFVIYEISY